MEVFFDGGLFELFLVVGIGYSLNFIFQKKYLLILFSIVSIVAPVLLLFANLSEIFIGLASVSIFNAFFLITLLWKQRLARPNQPLFEVKKYIDKYFKRKERSERKHNKVLPR